MNQLIKILTIIICATITQTVNAQYLGTNRTAAVAKSVKTNNYSYSYIIAGYYGIAVVTKPNTTKQNNTDITNQNLNTNLEVETKLYPNPFTNYVKIKFAKKIDNFLPQISIIDATGKTIAPKYEISESNNFYLVTINTTNLKQGRYIIKIFAANQIIALKAVKI